MQQENCDKLFQKIFPFWEKLTPSEQERLCRYSSRAQYQKGANIHGSNGECTGAIVVQSGCVRAYMMSEEGREITLYRLFPGDVCMLSASCVLQAITFDVMVDAEEDSDCYILNGKVFGEIADQNIYVKNFALETAVARFSDVMWAMQQILFMSFDKRLAIFLLDELTKSGGTSVQLTQTQIAKYLGSAREVVSRMLHYFRGEGIVAVTRGGVTILDKKKLYQIANG